MPASRHKTTIEVDVDSRKIKGLGEEIKRALDDRSMTAFMRATERSTRAIDRMVAATERLAKIQAEGAKESGQPGFLKRTASTAVGVMLGRGAVGGRIAQFGQMLARPATGGGFFGAALHAIPYVGPILAGSLENAEGYYHRYVGLANARMSAYGSAGAYGARGFTALGYNQSETAQQLSQISQLSGRTGTDLSSIAGKGAAYSRFLGVNPMGILQGAETLGNVRNPTRLMESALSSAIMIGFRRSHWSEAIQGLSNEIGGLQRRGINIAPESVVTLYGAVANLNKTSMRGQAGAGLASALMRVGGTAGAGNTPLDYMLFQAAGGGRGGTRTAVEARVYAEQHPGEVSMRMIHNLLSHANSESDRQAIASALSRHYQISMSQAWDLAHTSPEDLAGAFRGGAAAAQQPGVAPELLATAREAAPDLDTLQKEAKLADDATTLGAQVRSGVQHVEELEMTMTRDFLPAAMDAVEHISGKAQEVVEAYREGGFPAAAEAIIRIGTEEGARHLNTAVPSGAGAAADALRNHFGDNPVSEALDRIQNATAPSGGATHAPDGTPYTTHRGVGLQASLEQARDHLLAAAAALSGAVDASQPSDANVVA